MIRKNQFEGQRWHVTAHIRHSGSVLADTTSDEREVHLYHDHENGLFDMRLLGQAIWPMDDNEYIDRWSVERVRRIR